MALADDLKATQTNVAASIDAAIAMIATLRSGAGTVPDSEVQTVITNLEASRMKLDSAVTPPAA